MTEQAADFAASYAKLIDDTNAEIADLNGRISDVQKALVLVSVSTVGYKGSTYDPAWRMAGAVRDGITEMTRRRDQLEGNLPGYASQLAYFSR